MDFCILTQIFFAYCPVKIFGFLIAITMSQAAIAIVARKKGDVSMKLCKWQL